MLLSSTHLLVLLGSCSFHTYPFNMSVVSSAQVFFSSYQVLNLFSNKVFSTLFIFVVFFLSICSTSQGSLVSLVCQTSNFVLLPALPLFFGAILDLGTRSSRSGGVL